MAIDESAPRLLIQRAMRRRSQLGLSGSVVLLLLVIVTVIYTVIALSPAWYNNLEAKQAMREVANMAHYEKSDARLIYELQKRLRRVGAYFEDKDGEKVEVSPIWVEDEEVEIERDDERQKIVIRFAYEREVTLPLLGQSVTLHFDPEIEGDTAAVKW